MGSLFLKEKFCCVIGILDVYSCSLRFDIVLVRGINNGLTNGPEFVLYTYVRVKELGQELKFKIALVARMKMNYYIE